MSKSNSQQQKITYYKCPFCKEEIPDDGSVSHDCSRYDRILKRGFEKSKSGVVNPFANIFLECRRKGVDFVKAYTDFHQYQQTKLATDRMPPEYIWSVASLLFDSDEFIRYMAGLLKCSVRNFYIPFQDTLDELLKIASDSYSETYEMNFDYDKKFDARNYTIALDENLVGTKGEIVVSKRRDENNKYYYGLAFFIGGFHLGDEEFVHTPEYSFYVSDDRIKDFYEEVDESYYWEANVEAASFEHEKFLSICEALRTETRNGTILWFMHDYEISDSKRMQYRTIWDKKEIVIEHGKNFELSFNEWCGNNSKKFNTDDSWRLMIRYPDNTALLSFEYPYELRKCRIEKDFIPSKEETDAAEVAYLELHNLANMIEAAYTPQKRRELLDQKPIRKLEYTDVVVLDSTIRCHLLAHKVEPYKGLIDILKNDGTTEDYSIYVGYCPTCNTYQVFNSDYRRMLEQGRPLCQVVGVDELLKAQSKVAFKYKSQSILNAMGYTVNAADDKSPEDRRNILNRAIKNKLIQVQDALDFLNWLIVTRKPEPRFSRAISKWRDDMNYIENEYANECIKVRSISIKG